MNNATTTAHDMGNNETLSTGIAVVDGGFLALTLSESKPFKTRAGAERWLAKRGYKADGSRLVSEPAAHPALAPMAAVVAAVVTSFATDFTTHDTAALARTEKSKAFAWVARSTGTFIDFCGPRRDNVRAVILAAVEGSGLCFWWTGTQLVRVTVDELVEFIECELRLRDLTSDEIDSLDHIERRAAMRSLLPV